MSKDIHHHFIPEILKKYKTDLPEWDISLSLNYLKKEGLKKAVLSLSYYDIDFNTKEDYVSFCKNVNNELRAIVHHNREHFEAFAVLPFPYVDECIKELQRIRSFEFAGIILYTNVKGVYPSSIEHKKLFTAFHESTITLFIHPGNSLHNERDIHNAASDFIEYPQDVPRLIARFFAEDLFEKYPGISYVLSHAGGLLTYQFSRIGKLVYLKCLKDMIKIRWGRILGDLVTKKIRVIDYMDRITFDLAGFTREEQLAALNSNVRRENCSFGSDFPYFYT